MKPRNTRSIAFVVALLATGLAACGGSSSAAPAPPEADSGSPPVIVAPPAASFTLTLDTDKVVLLPGSAANVRAAVTRNAGITIKPMAALTEANGNSHDVALTRLWM